MPSRKPCGLSHQKRTERRRKMAAAVKSGKTLSQVAKKFGVCLASVRNACHEAGVDWRAN